MQTRHAIERHMPALRRYAISLTGNADTADDLVQDTILRMLSRADTSITAPRVYMMRMLHNLFIDRTRRVKRRAAQDVDDLEIPSMDAPQNLALTAKQILAAIHSLPPGASDILIRHAQQDQSYAEIAADLNIPIGTVMSRLGRARAQLRQSLCRENAGCWEREDLAQTTAETGF